MKPVSSIIDVIYIQFNNEPIQSLTILEAVSLKLQIEKQLKEPMDDRQYLGLHAVWTDLKDKIQKAQGPVADALRGNSNSSLNVDHGTAT